MPQTPAFFKLLLHLCYFHRFSKVNYFSHFDFPWHVPGVSKRLSTHAGQVDFTARQITFLAQFPYVK